MWAAAHSPEDSLVPAAIREKSAGDTIEAFFSFLSMLAASM